MIINDIDENYGSGYIKLFRSLRNHWIWNDPIKLRWWLDIILEVNHKPKTVDVKYDVVFCDRGQSVRSLEGWSKRWLVDKTTVNRFFKMLEKDRMVKLENLKITTRLTVCNYASYNDTRNANETQMKRDAFQIETGRITNKNVKNDNNEKNIIESAPKSERFLKFEDWLKINAERVTKMQKQITELQFNSLIEKHPQPLISDTLIKMHNYKPLLSKNVDAYLTLINWISRETK